MSVDDRLLESLEARCLWKRSITLSRHVYEVYDKYYWRQVLVYWSSPDILANHDLLPARSLRRFQGQRPSATGSQRWMRHEKKFIFLDQEQQDSGQRRNNLQQMQCSPSLYLK